MTKKITITLEENLIDELGLVALESGKKKAQVIREALQEYFDVQSISKTVQEYKMGTLKPLSHHDIRVELGL
ncbi:MAG: CopG family transcriptional regulator [Epsilonproteobacteria bacterium]|nr:ribbon-helix-helix domain-containing protein [Sulfurospirillum sp.]NCD12868.1 CopG family transcriptional regulator [Campylobacterota bacterium]